MKEKQSVSIMYLILSCLIGILVILLGHHFFTRLRLYRAWLSLNKTFTLPFIGSFWFFHKLAKGNLAFLEQALIENDSRIAIWFGQNLMVLTSKPKDWEAVLKNPNCLEKPEVLYDKMKEFFGGGLLVSKIDRWRRNRKILNKGFIKSALESYTSDLCNKSEVLIENLRKNFQPNDDILMYYYDFALDAFCTSFLGINGRLASGKFNFGELITRINVFTIERLTIPKYMFDFVFFKTKRGSEFKRTLEELDEFIKLLINQSNENLAFDSPESQKNSDLLFNKIKDPNLLPRGEYMDEFAVFLFASTDTTALGMGIITILLGLFQDMQEEIYSELKEVLGNRREITHHDLKEIKYLERFILESLRLFPLAPLMGRILGGDVDLGDVTLPDGIGLVVNSMRMHRDPVNFPDPLRFDPNRFLPEECAKRNPYSYVPFSVGNRNCIGAKYAMMELKIGLANLIRNFHISCNYQSIKEMEVICIVLSKLKNGYKCTLHPR